MSSLFTLRSQMCYGVLERVPVPYRINSAYHPD